MYRLVIIDDEPLIREGLVRHINWNSSGFEVVADFDDGSEALEYIRHNPVDAVLTDIIMCDVDGMELCRRLSIDHPSIRTVLLSGHRQFEYAKEAMKYNVFDYLLKPIKKEEIEQTFSALRREMDKDAEKSVSLSERDILSKGVQDLLKSVLYLQLYLKNDLPLRDLCWYLHAADISERMLTENIYFYKIAPAKDENTGAAHMERLYRYMHTDLIASQHAYGHVVRLDTGSGVLIVFAGSDHGASFTAKKVMELIGQETHLEVELDLLWQHEPLDRLVSASAYHTFVENNSGYKTEYIQLLNKYHLFALCFALNNDEGLKKLTDEFCSRLADLPVEDAHFLAGALLWLISLSPNLPIQFVRALRVLLTGEETDPDRTAQQWLRGCIDRVFTRFGSMDTVDEDPVIEKVKKYVAEHISEDISITVVSQLVHFNPAYFGRYFKTHAGETFNEYLVRVRMQKAIEIMKTQHCKVDEISSRIGYDTKYFFSVFKKYTGYRPMEYYRKFVQS